MHRDRITGLHGDRSALAIEHDVDDELQPDRLGGVPHELLKGIAFDLAQTHAGLIQKLRPVRQPDRFFTPAADHHRLAAAGITGVLMRFDHARGNDEITVSSSAFTAMSFISALSIEILTPFR